MRAVYVLVFVLTGCSSESTSIEPGEPVIGAVSEPALEPALEPAIEAVPEPAIEPTSERSAPSHADHIRLAVFLRNGRRASHEGDPTSALVAFRQGLEIDPHHPTLLCEAGWAAFQVGDPGARAYLEEGARTMAPSERRAACLYSLGRWFEGHAEAHVDSRGADLEAAASAYHESLTLRPGNAPTAARVRALESAASHGCAPSERFSTLEAAREALRADSDTADTRLAPLSAIGAGPGALSLIADAPEEEWATWYVALETAAGVDVLAEIGASWERSCSVGGVEVTRAEWVTEPEPMLVLELHEVSEYGCAPSPWELCLENATLPSDCDSASAETPLETTDERYRIVCAERAGRHRCSVAGNSRDGIANTARLGPLPHGAALDALLACP